MSDDMILTVLGFMLVVLFGTMIGTYQIAKLGDGYVSIPSNRYCDSLGYVKPEPMKDKP